MWKPDIEKHEDVDIEVYKFMFERAKEKFEEIKSESEVITARAYRTISVLIVFLSGLVGVSISITNRNLFYAALILYAVDFLLLIYLLLSRTMALRGSAPRELFVAGFDKFSNQEKRIYYMEICRIQEGITLNRASNGIRRPIYVVSVVLTTILIVTTIYFAIQYFQPS